MSRGTLQKIQPLHAELIPPAGSVPCGITPDGKQLYRQFRKLSRAVPDIDPVTGQQKFRKNLQTAEPMYPINRPQVYEEERIFYLESQGNANVGVVLWTPPSAEELARAERAHRVKQAQEGLAEAMVDAGVEPTDLIAMLKAGKTMPPGAPVAGVPSAKVPDAPKGKTDDGIEYPHHTGGGWYRLSDGSKMQGTKSQAEEAELAVMQAREDSAATPEE